MLWWHQLFMYPLHCCYVQLRSPTCGEWYMNLWCNVWCTQTATLIIMPMMEKVSTGVGDVSNVRDGEVDCVCYVFSFSFQIEIEFNYFLVVQMFLSSILVQGRAVVWRGCQSCKMNFKTKEPLRDFSFQNTIYDTFTYTWMCVFGYREKFDSLTLNERVVKWLSHNVMITDWV